MAGEKGIDKPVCKRRFDEVLKLRNCTYKKLGETLDTEINRSTKTIQRYLKKGKMPHDLLERISKFLDIDPDYMSGRYHKSLSKIEDNHIRKILLKQITPEKFPYLTKSNITFGYNTYLELILNMHYISMRQFNALSPEDQKKFQLEIEYAITSTISRFFTIDAKGREGLPDLERLAMEIDCHDPFEPN